MIMSVIVPSLSNSREFYIFRDDGVEVKCFIDDLKIIRSVRYRLSPEERKFIKQKYVGLVKKVPVYMKHYVNPLIDN